jgi:hypothetical protein
MKNLPITKLFAIMLYCFFAQSALAQCCNYHATLLYFDDCSVAGDKTQTANVTNGTGPFTYQWYNPATNAIVAGTTSNNTSGVSYVMAIVTDANGCVDTTMADYYTDKSSCTTIGFPPTTISPTCANFNIIISKNDGPTTGDVLITGTPSGGTSSTFNYFWYGQATSGYVSGTGSGPSFTTTPLKNGLHFMQVTDGNGCQARDSVYIDDCNLCIICQSDSISLNTGINDAYALLPGGSFDNHWVLTSTPSIASSAIPPFVVSVPDPGWANITSPVAKWINYDDVAGPNSFEFGLHTFTRKFDVCYPGNFLINYTALADNDVSLYIDGTLISSTTGASVGYLLPNAAVATNFPITLSAGTHRIDAVVNNVGNIQGLWVNGKISPALTSPGKLIPDTCIPVQQNQDPICNFLYDDFSNAALWNHPVLSSTVSCISNFNTLAITSNKFRFLQSRDNNFNYMYRNVGLIDNNNFNAKIDFKHQTTVPGWGTGHTVLALTSLPLPFHNDPSLSAGGPACSATTLMGVTNSVLDGIEVAFESTGTASMSTYDFKVYLKDNGVKTSVGTPINVPGNIASFIKLKRSGTTTGLLEIFSDAAHTTSLGSTTFTIPASINGLSYVVFGTHEYQENDRMLTGNLDNLCIKVGAPLGINNPALLEQKIQVYPNPANDFINFSENINVVVQDITGKQIIMKINCNNLNISTLPQGLYILQIQDNKGQVLHTTKLIKK